MSASSPKSLVYGALVTQTLLSAGTFLAGKRALEECDPLALAAMRFVLASACFLALLRFTGGALVPPRRLWRSLVVLGLVGVPLNQGLFLAGLVTTTPAHAALMYALTPIFVYGISLARGTEELVGLRVVGLLSALVGASVVVLERSGGEVGGGSLHGDLLILGASISWATYTVFQKPIATEFGAIPATSWALVAGTVLFLPVGVPRVAATPIGSLSPTFWALLGFLVVLTSVVSYLCWGYALRSLDASRVAVFTNLQPVATAALAWAIFDDVVTPRLVAGGALVLAGVLAATRRRA